MTRVFVLGAGFSKAISTEMPVMDELSRRARSELSARNERPIPGGDTPLAENFEQWLSYLFEAPPWLNEAERALNRWGFITLTDTVYEVLWTLQLRALSTPCPDWLKTLVRYWQQNSSTVTTFNYDLLVEIAHAVFTNHALASMYSVPLTFMDARDSMVFGREKTDEGLRLLKMHGSLNWRYSGPGSPPGDIVYEVGYESTGNTAVSISRAQDWGVEAISRSVDDGWPGGSDRVPLIVPPTTVKSPYYMNQTLQLIWRQAAHGLRNAEEVVLMGFGLPATDLLVASLLATSFPLTESSIITPVDYAEGIVDRVRSVFKLKADDGRVVDRFAGLGEDAIPEWVKQFAAGGT